MKTFLQKADAYYTFYFVASGQKENGPGEGGKEKAQERQMEKKIHKNPGPLAWFRVCLERIAGYVEMVSGYLVKVPGSLEIKPGGLGEMAGGLEMIAGPLAEVPGRLEVIPGRLEKEARRLGIIPGPLGAVARHLEMAFYSFFIEAITRYGRTNKFAIHYISIY